MYTSPFFAQIHTLKSATPVACFDSVARTCTNLLKQSLTVRMYRQSRMDGVSGPMKSMPRWCQGETVHGYWVKLWRCMKDNPPFFLWIQITTHPLTVLDNPEKLKMATIKYFSYLQDGLYRLLLLATCVTESSWCLCSLTLDLYGTLPRSLKNPT